DPPSDTPTGLADGFGREVRPTARSRIHPGGALGPRLAKRLGVVGALAGHQSQHRRDRIVASSPSHHNARTTRNGRYRRKACAAATVLWYIWPALTTSKHDPRRLDRQDLAQ